jgi:hypothetical protein
VQIAKERFHSRSLLLPLCQSIQAARWNPAADREWSRFAEDHESQTSLLRTILHISLEDDCGGYIISRQSNDDVVTQPQGL